MRKGFTLIELIVCLAILAALAALCLPTFNGLINNAREKVDIANARTLYTATQVCLLKESVKKDFYGNNIGNFTVTNEKGERYRYDVVCRITAGRDRDQYSTKNPPFRNALLEELLNSGIRVKKRKGADGLPLDSFYIGYRKNNPTVIEIWVGAFPSDSELSGFNMRKSQRGPRYRIYPK